MVIESLRENIQQIKELIREMYIFTNQMDIINKLESGSGVVINTKEKKLLKDANESLLTQLKILNNSIPSIINKVGFFKPLANPEGKPGIPQIKDSKIPLVQVKYKPQKSRKKINIVIDNKMKGKFLESLTKSNVSINKLKKEFSARPEPVADFGKSNVYARISNHFFRETSNKILMKGYLTSLNMDLRRINSHFVVGTYTSMILFTMLISAFGGLFLLGLLLFYNLNLTIPFLEPSAESAFIRFLKFFWIVFAIPLCAGGLLYYFPKSEAKSLGGRIDQELPFVTIHMSAIATSGVEPINAFKIIIKSEEYKYTKKLFRRLINLINFHGYDLVTALKLTAQASPSIKLKELLDSMATTITSGGNLHNFLNEHAESLLFDYRMEREKYTKVAETFMDIYISIVIAAPMILLILFVIMGSTGMYFLGIGVDLMGFLIILAIILLNAMFLILLKLKQPIF